MMCLQTNASMINPKIASFRERKNWKFVCRSNISGSRNKIRHSCSFSLLFLFYIVSWNQTSILIWLFALWFFFHVIQFSRIFNLSYLFFRIPILLLRACLQKAPPNLPDHRLLNHSRQDLAGQMVCKPRYEPINCVATFFGFLLLVKIVFILVCNLLSC